MDIHEKIKTQLECNDVTIIITELKEYSKIAKEELLIHAKDLISRLQLCVVNSDKIKIELHYKDIALIAVVLGNYNKDKDKLIHIRRLVDRLGYEMCH